MERLKRVLEDSRRLLENSTLSNLAPTDTLEQVNKIEEEDVGEEVGTMEEYFAEDLKEWREKRALEQEIEDNSYSENDKSETLIDSPPTILTNQTARRDEIENKVETEIIESDYLTDSSDGGSVDYVLEYETEDEKLEHEIDKVTESNILETTQDEPTLQDTESDKGGSPNFTTMYLEEHNVLRSTSNGFCVYDTRGVDINSQLLEASLDEVSTWISDGVTHNHLCIRPGDEKSMAASVRMAASVSSLITNNNGRYTKRKVNCVMVVANLAEINEAFLSGNMKPLQAIGHIFRLPCNRISNGSPILILTHGDELKTEERINSRLKVCEYLGISETTGCYDIACLSEQGILPIESDPVTAFALTEAVYRSLIVSDRSHLPKRRFVDWIFFLMLWFMRCIASFFAILARFFSRFEHNHKILKL